MHWVVHFFGLAVLLYFMTDQLTFLWVRRVYAIVYRFFIPGGWVIFIDLDSLKKINDENTHEMGDRALQEVARVLLKLAWPFAFRRGGGRVYCPFPRFFARRSCSCRKDTWLCW